MRSTHIAVLLAGLAIGALTIAPSASAQETAVEPRAEPSSELCNPCTVHGTGESHIIALPSGVEITTCEDEFVSRVYSSGSGEVEWVARAHGGAGCNTTNCTVMSPHWPASNPGELGGEVEHFTVGLCLRLNTTEVECNLEVRVTRTPTTHVYQHSVNQLCAGGARRLEASGTMESGSIEGIHAS